MLARGPWEPDQVAVSWLSDPYEPTVSATEAADVAVQGLRDRGSPSHDGLAGRLVRYEANNGRLMLELQPARWALRLNPPNDAQGMSALVVVRAADGSWLAGRRAAWLASWAGRWALGAAGSVEVAENPAHTMRRELLEEWSVEPERLRVEALIRSPTGVIMLVGQAWLPEGAEVIPDDEHDDFAWWPADIANWPAEADDPLRLIASLLAVG